MSGHGHHHPGNDRGLLWALVVNVALTVVQIVGGIVAGSLALIADAVHNLSDAVSLGIAWFARRVARRPADAAMTFGYGRAELVAALVNYTTLIVIGLYLVYEAAWRFVEPAPVDGWIVVIVAGVALLVDAVTALLTWRLSRHSVNVRAAFLHNVADALGSVGVIVAGAVILLHDWRLIDPLVTLGIAGYVLWQAFTESRGVVRMLMLGSPADVDRAKLVAALEAVDGVVDVHHVHVWQIDESRRSCDAHVVVHDASWDGAEAVKAAVRDVLRLHFGIVHSTLELEREDADCC